jgi:hypothetical protein
MYYYLINIVTGEICDVWADSLEKAIERACVFFGNNACDYEERFKKQEENKMISIVKEHYRDFVGTLSVRRAEIKEELESIPYDEENWFEYNTLDKEFGHLTAVQEFFMDSSRWGCFKSLELLKLYVQNIRNTYASVNAYSKTVFSVESGELVGVTQEEWDELEEFRYELLKKLEAWALFADFCENGMI